MPRGSKCMPYSNDGGYWNATRCVPVADDPNGVGEACTVVGNGLSGEDDCDDTSMCFHVDPETDMGTCVPFCVGPASSPSCLDPCTRCAISESPLTLCLPLCDPLTQSCGRGQGCYPLGDQLVCAPELSREGAGVGSPCGYVNDCPVGMACMDVDEVPGCPEGSNGCCTPFCAVGAPDECSASLPGTSCVPLFEGGGGTPMECLSAPVGVCVQG